jgi:hypothetical protein
MLIYCVEAVVKFNRALREESCGVADDEQDREYAVIGD